MPTEATTLTCVSPARTGRTRFLLIIADPDQAAAEKLALTLESHQIDAVIVADGADVLLQTGILLPNAILVAASVAPLGATTIAKTLHNQTCIPVVVAAGDDPAEAAQAVAALAAGAAACVARPYRVGEVLPILRSIGPETVAGLQAALTAGSLRLDPAAMEVSVSGQRVRLPLREFQLLQLLMANADRVVTRDQIVSVVWKGEDHSNTVNVHIRRLRARLGDDPNEPHMIVAVRGIGYRLIPPQP